MLMSALSICTDTPFDFTESDMPAIRRWWCVQLMERFCIEGHGHRFAFWTEESKALLEGRLTPVVRLPRSRTTQEHPFIRDLKPALQWLRDNHSSLKGDFQEPAFLRMSPSHQSAVREGLEASDSEDRDELRDHFLFIFEEMEDMEKFFEECGDEKKLKVNAFCANAYTNMDT
ncbi:structural maintenance of chromosomes protein 5-like [Melanotaenia boesemani]|uniref:structural maintenance of chromosomes protein 5-like n=1 Tax=Melanotaenia boesemani TaxID=1250792 RepID=UPI001C043E49|nr:structural maintenance of chromosomes protein 5-like [Melanotaenia boesemani]XP_041834122.1 structural maintenance of chromosomes protein 5-like [Melanotaenia boesemani]XP_041834123.1 structural maintenance of chromosomes protein 5-like [Melanotaenia boesemani]XP_041834124.1 structural maintenance of chromosomes protein 5-like [Melanotaenia boesemani]